MIKSAYIAVAKFFVESVEKKGYTNKGVPNVYQIVVKLKPVFASGSDDPNNENAQFWKASPGGNMELYIDNPNLFDAFVVGEEIYLPMMRASTISLAQVSSALHSLPLDTGEASAE